MEMMYSFKTTKESCAEKKFNGFVQWLNDNNDKTLLLFIFLYYRVWNRCSCAEKAQERTDMCSLKRLVKHFVKFGMEDITLTVTDFAIYFSCHQKIEMVKIQMK